jgi:hypothetical protein
MKQYITNPFPSLKEALESWDKVPSANLRLSPFYSFSNYKKDDPKTIQLSFIVKNDKEKKDIEKIKEYLELEEVPTLTSEII